MVRRKKQGDTTTSMARRDRDVWDETPRTPERLELTEIDSIIKTPPFTSRGGRTSPTWDEYHSEEYFDINPKTDYTYAHSLSYNPAYTDDPDIIPNMSRHRINSHASGYSLHQSGLDTPPSYSSDSRRAARRRKEELEYEERRRHDELEERRRLEEEMELEEQRRRRLEDENSQSISTSYSRVTYRTDGMVLRSGNKLSSVGSYLERNSRHRLSPSVSQGPSSHSLARSLNSEFEAERSSQSVHHSTPLSHLYAKNSKSDTSQSVNNLSVSGIFSPSQKIVKTVVTTETTEYIDSEGSQRNTHQEEDEQANTSGWFSGIRNRIRGSQSETTLTEQTEETETDLTEKQTRGGGWFGLFSRKETEEEEEEARRNAEAVKDDTTQSHNGGWFGIFRRSETVTTEEEEARQQALASESDSEMEEMREDDEEQPGWRNRFKNLLFQTTEEKWQTESVKETDKDALGGASDSNGGWFRWLRMKDTHTTEDTTDSNTGWIGRSRSNHSESNNKNVISEDHKEDETDTKSGWFGWGRTEENTTALEEVEESEAGLDQVDRDSKSRLFSWLGRSNEEKVTNDMNETEGKGSSGWFGWLWSSSKDTKKDGPRKSKRRSKGRRVTFSLDSDAEEDDGYLKAGASSSSLTQSSSYSSRTSSSSSSSSYRSQTWMQLILTAITTVSSFISGIFRPLVDSYACRQIKFIIWRSLRIVDMWIVSRPVAGCCCLCLPLLLLLPLLLGYLYGGTLLEQARASVKSFTILSANETQARPMPYVDPSTISVKIQQFFEEHKHRYELNQLTEKDVERIAQKLISGQLDDLKLALLQDINQMKADQAASKTSHVNSMDSLDKKLGDFLSKYQSLENDIAALRSGNDQMRQDKTDQIHILEGKIKSLGDDIYELQHSHLELLASVKNCCRNDSFYAMAVRKHVQEIFSQMMAGGGGSGGSSGSGSDDGYGAFLQWLQANYARKEDMDAELAKVSEGITQRILAITKEQASSVYIQSNTQQGPAVSEDYIRWIVDDALQKFSADQTGMADYALESAGGSVLSVRCSETYYKKTALVSVFGIPLWYTTNSPRTVIQPDVHPGQCWAFKGARGFLVLQLAFPVKPSGFTLEHIPKSLSPTGNINSAPREFAVYGLASESDKVGVSLGNYTYSESGKPIQYFPVQATSGEFFELVELKVLGNHGNHEYTCLYRFRVHGMPYKPS